jgi:hypothetical protein
LAKDRLPQELVKQLQDDPTGGKSPASIRALYEKPHPLVIPMNPLALDERLAVQQGVFLSSLDITRRLPDLLRSLDTPGVYAHNVRKLSISCSLPFICEALSELQRMNITRLSLFPGIDGLANSLNNLLAMPHRFVAETTWGEP